MTYWRLIGSGAKSTGDYRFNDGLSTVPHGMGLLLSSGYLGAANVFYCPSSDNMRPDTQQYAKAGGWKLGHWKTTGGFDAKTFLYGRWGDTTTDSEWKSGTVEDARTNYIWSHYGYRCVPFMEQAPDCVYKERSKTGNSVVGFTWPPVHYSFGAPLFRTQRLLGGRAVVSDTFSKGSRYDASGRDLYGGEVPATTIADTIAFHGMGLYAHRTSYSVLYGDGHVSPDGDPQEKVAWHGQGSGSTWRDRENERDFTARTGGNGDTGPNILANNSVSNGSPNEPKPVYDSSPGWQYSSWSIWHDFDLHARIDVTPENLRDVSSLGDKYDF